KQERSHLSLRHEQRASCRRTWIDVPTGGNAKPCSCHCLRFRHNALTWFQESACLEERFSTDLRDQLVVDERESLAPDLHGSSTCGRSAEHRDNPKRKLWRRHIGPLLRIDQQLFESGRCRHHGAVAQRRRNLYARLAGFESAHRQHLLLAQIEEHSEG